MAEVNRQDRDLVLAPGEFAFVQDTTKGTISVNVGPYNKTISANDKMVVWDKSRDKRRFVPVDMERAIQRDVVAPEGYYLALYNPAIGKQHPDAGASAIAVDLNVGQRVNIPGPAYFPLWPGQYFEVIRGHHLHSNQYLIAQVYNADAAIANAANAVVKPQGEATPGDVTSFTPKTFAPGQLMVIKGTDVAFFIPPSGIKVVPEGGSGTTNFVRDAVTLERLEYCILLDEDGNKRYVQGPAVVFPEPTEAFITRVDDETGQAKRKFLAIELNDTTGIYVKVIADYEDGGMKHRAGEELFITGKERAIYYQREEHSVIRYGNQTKHYAVAVPSGEGRYVLNRKSGEIKLVRGPIMLLCDPRSEVIVRRVLSPKAATLLYPGNARVLKVNADLEAQTKSADASQYEAGRVMRAASVSNYAALNAMEEQAVTSSRQIVGDTFTRGTSFTPPRTLTLDTKYEGAVSVSIWTGYAVLVVNKTGDRRVVEGPETLLLEYDETLAPLGLSTGKPKTTQKLYETVYLRVSNNSVSDVVPVETKDLVRLNVEISYRVNFEGDQEKWFAVENYVGLLTDHMRSLIRNTVKRLGVEQFYGNAIDIIRDAILGTATGNGVGRNGRAFGENGMRVYDVEVTNVTIADANVAKLLGEAQVRALTATVKITEEERALAIATRSAEIARTMAETNAETAERTAQASLREVKAIREVTDKRLEAQAAETAGLETISNATASATLGRQKMADEQRLAIKERDIQIEMVALMKQSEEIVKRAAAISPGMIEALRTVSDNALVERIATSLAPMAAAYNISAAEALGKMFKDTPLALVMEQLAARPKLTLKP